MAENSQLSERVCLDENELSRLRGRLAEVRSTQMSSTTSKKECDKTGKSSIISIGFCIPIRIEGTILAIRKKR